MRKHNEMRTVRSPRVMQKIALDLRQKGKKVGFVPTMGYLHDGHLSLIRKARQLVGTDGVVVVSVFVNPTQFGPTEDYSTYPRDLARDTELCRQAGVDILFAPDAEQMYPKKAGQEYSTYVVEERLSRTMEGTSRPTHFRGVTTVVAKLFNLVLPTVSVFGAKDWQQATIIKQMVVDLNFPVRIVVAPTVREPDGLAMSSRNKYLSPDERKQATVLWRAICRAREIVRSARAPVAADLIKQELAELIRTEPAAQIDYIELFESNTLQPVQTASRGTHLALAVRIGQTRLIDNAKL